MVLYKVEIKSKEFGIVPNSLLLKLFINLCNFFGSDYFSSVAIDFLIIATACLICASVIVRGGANLMMCW